MKTIIIKLQSISTLLKCWIDENSPVTSPQQVIVSDEERLFSKTVNHDSCPTSYIISVVLCLPVPCFHLAQLVTAVSEQGKMDGGI